MNNTSSILFGDDSTANQQPPQNNGCKYHQQDRMKSNIFEDQSNTNSGQHGGSCSGKNRSNNPREGGYNPITGQSYEKEEDKQSAVVVNQEPLQAQVPAQVTGTKAEEQTSKPVHTSSRVLQPPGGRSTSLW
jgi:hypothetical protein